MTVVQFTRSSSAMCRWKCASATTTTTTRLSINFAMIARHMTWYNGRAKGTPTRMGGIIEHGKLSQDQLNRINKHCVGLDVRVPLSDSAITLTRLWLAAHRIIYVADPCRRRRRPRPSCHPPNHRPNELNVFVVESADAMRMAKPPKISIWSFCSSCAQTSFAR